MADAESATLPKAAGYVSQRGSVQVLSYALANTLHAARGGLPVPRNCNHGRYRRVLPCTVASRYEPCGWRRKLCA